MVNNIHQRGIKDFPERRPPVTESDYRKMLIPPLDEVGFKAFSSALLADPVKGCAFKPGDLSCVLSAVTGAEPDPVFTGYALYPYGTFVGRQPLYLAGGLYPMDRSAFAVSSGLAEALKGRSKPRVIDLCAAPGGKTIALSDLVDLGFVLANDISRKRAGILRTNLERSGIPDCAVTCQEPGLIAQRLGPVFDAVILDAPCSGSGMTRKDEEMGRDWSLTKVHECADLQRNLLDSAYQLLAPGGILSYSTCSYSREEDEDQVADFLRRHGDISIVPTPSFGGIDGIGGIGYRYVPGLFKGEGQYRCLLAKSGTAAPVPTLPLPTFELGGRSYSGIDLNGVRRIISDLVDGVVSLAPIKLGYAVENTDREMKAPYDWDLSHLTDIFLPSLELERRQAEMYLSGLDLRDAELSGEDGIVRFTYQGHPLGFGKRMRGRIRNLLPKGLRVAI